MIFHCKIGRFLGTKPAMLRASPDALLELWSSWVAPPSLLSRGGKKEVKVFQVFHFHFYFKISNFVLIVSRYFDAVTVVFHSKNERFFRHEACNAARFSRYSGQSCSRTHYTSHLCWRYFSLRIRTDAGSRQTAKQEKVHPNTLFDVSATILFEISDR